MTINFGNTIVNDEFTVRPNASYAEYRGLGGDDMYNVLPGLTKDVKIVDSVGNNTVILGNANIKSSVFFERGFKLTYAEGGTLTVLGEMDSFKFVFGGGESVADLTIGGTVKTFAETVASFGLNPDDLGSTPIPSPKTDVTINDNGTVGDVNDENTAPVINAITDPIIDETVAIGINVITITATDADHDDLTYSLTDDNNGLFAIDSNSGVITLNGTLDYETATTHKLTVVANDGTVDSEAVTFTVIVGDVNEDFNVNIDEKGSIDSPHTIDALEKNYTFTDDFDIIQHVIIQNFSQGDKILISNNLGVSYNFTNDGTDAIITYNFEAETDTGIPKVATIILKNVIMDPEAIVSDEASLELLIGDVITYAFNANSIIVTGIPLYPAEADFII